MPLLLHEVKVWNEGPEAYRLIIKDGEEIVGQTNAIYPGPGSIALKSRITGPLTLIAEKV